MRRRCCSAAAVLLVSKCGGDAAVMRWNLPRKCGGPVDGNCCGDAAAMMHGSAMVRLPCGGAAGVRQFGRPRCGCYAVDVL